MADALVSLNGGPRLPVPVGTASRSRAVTPLFEPFAKQREYIDAVFSGRFRQLLYGGAIRGGKSYVLIALLFIFCRLFPGSRWAIVRKDMPTLRKNVLPVFEEIRPTRFCGPFNQGTWTAICRNGSQILLWAEQFTRDPMLNRWRGLEVNGFAFEEVNEMQEASWNKGIERAGSWKVRGGGPQPPPWLLASCNPAEGWVKEKFYDPWESGSLEPPQFYLPATIDDNPHVDPVYRASLNDLPEPEYRRFVLGDWTVSMHPQQLIKFEWVEAALKGHWPSGELILQRRGVRRMGVDVARTGDDKTCFSLFDGNSLYGLHEYDALWLDEGAVKIIEVASDEGIPADLVNVDAVGLGAGTVDICHSHGFEVREVLSGNAALMIEEAGDAFSFFRFGNRRDQIWWQVREMLRRGRLRIAIPDSPARKRLIADLMAPRYKVKGDKTFEVEDKDAIKKRLGRSPDDGESFVYAWAKTLPRHRRPALPPSVSAVSLTA